MSRLVIASNRTADLDQGPQSGGLAVAVGDALKQTNGLWFGWDGTVVEDGDPVALKVTRHASCTTATVPLTRSEHESYYLGFANRVLWPAFHYRLDLAVLEPAFVEGYRRVNAGLAQRLAKLIEPDDVVWVHDYHMIPLASELRRLGVTNKIGFFLHIPFPPPEVLAAVPEHEWLASTMFSYDVIGLQTTIDTANFVRYVTEHADGVALGGDRMEAFGRVATVRTYPIGIDCEAFRAMSRTAAADAMIERLRRHGADTTHIVGVDRLDYTKGLPDRLRAFRRLLELHPEHHKTVTLMQIASPTRGEVEAYADIRSELEGLSGAINGEFGDVDWTPIRYIHRSVQRPTLAALFRGSRVGLVTPLRDCMNLVAKEFVAAQDDDDPGVLVLSRFAGAAEDLAEALIVNPFDTEEVAMAMQRALTMPIEERRERQSGLIERVGRNDVGRWRRTFLATLEGTRGSDRFRVSRGDHSDKGRAAGLAGC